MSQRLLWWISEHGRLALISGLIAGLALPGLAAVMKPWLPLMVTGLLFVTALRIGHHAVIGALSDLRWGIGSVIVLQMLFPLCLFMVCLAFGLATTPAALAMILATSAPAISGAPNLALMLRQDAGRMMQIFVLGTALFPLTVLPLLTLMPQLGDPRIIAVTTLKLLGVIIGSTGAGFAFRAIVYPSPKPEQVKALDGLSVLAFSAIVVGLMAAVSPALRNDPSSVFLWAVLAFAISYGAQIATFLVLRRSRLNTVKGPLAIGAGNRNIALYLVALPEHLIAPLMLFIGCWQLPMYLTPTLMRWLYDPENQSE